MAETDRAEFMRRLAEFEWYHTVELAPGVLTPGRYDHRRYLRHYELPDDLSGKTVLDIGAASGFFSFEFEKRGGRVTAVDPPTWMAHDFGPRYQLDKPLSEAERYLRDPILFAK